MIGHGPADVRADDPYPGRDPATYDYHNTPPPIVGLGGLFVEDVPALAVLGNNHTDPNYPGWNLNITDQRRAAEFIQDMQKLIDADAVPALTPIWLPNDHTSGGYDPRFQVADNDTAVGQIVDFISHSSIWPESAIFITEEDVWPARPDGPLRLRGAAGNALPQRPAGPVVQRTRRPRP
jgi:hypothetical protein